MKKVLLTLMVVVSVFTCAFAVELRPAVKTMNDMAYRPVFINRFNRLAYDIWEEPAELADNKFIIDFPEVAVSFNNLASVLTDDICLEAIPEGDYLSPVMRYFTFMGNGTAATNEFMKIDLGFGSQIGGFAFRGDAKFGFETYNERGYASFPSMAIIPDIDVALSLGYGMRVFGTDAMNISAGLSIHPTLRAFTEEISVSNAIDNIDNFEELFKDCLFVGFALPIDFSVNVSLFDNQFKVYGQANNINGQYRYVSGDAETIQERLKDVLSSNDKFKAGHFMLDLGCTFQPKNWKIVSPVVYAELGDVYDFVATSIKEKDFNFRESLTHLNCGAYVEILDMLQLGFDYKDGYRHLSAGIGFNDIKVQAFYGASVYNNNVADTLTVAVKLGWDRN